MMPTQEHSQLDGDLDSQLDGDLDHNPVSDQPPDATTPQRHQQHQQRAQQWPEQVINLSWSIFMGWWLSVGYLLAAVLCAPLPAYRSAFCNLGWYFLWPFNKQVRYVRQPGPEPPTRHQALSFWYFRGVAAVLVVPLHCILAVAGWLLVGFVPMARLHTEAVGLVWTALPDRLLISRRGVDQNQLNGEVALDCECAGSWNSFLITVAGTHIVLLNLAVLIPITIALGYTFSDQMLRDHKLLLFMIGLVSIVPLCFTSGTLITRIALHGNSSIWGMMLSCTLGRSVELLLYVHLMTHELNNFVRDAIVGALIALMLLLPALTFGIGGLRFREQKFNLPHAGLSSVMLIVSIIGGFTPTLFHGAYANLEMFCKGCEYIPETTDLSIGCNSCHYKAKHLASEPLYQDYTKYLSIVCAVLLPASYITGLILLNHVNQHTTTGSPKLSSKSALDTGSTDPSTGTDHVVNLHEGLPPLLRTGVHGKEGWPLWACAVALFVCLGLAYGVTDVVANSLALIFPDDVSSGQTGVRLVALVPVALAPNLLHFVNAISFGFQNRISVSIEIASQAVIQITLTLMPALIFLSTFMDAIKNQDEPFTMWVLSPSRVSCQYTCQARSSHCHDLLSGSFRHSICSQWSSP
eukprot:TRINITY_DN1464_c0_g1_i2.p1 TRINITY_DN1464_c0_g1~~TRINITY_DN1464_c0_g1_i2.p1  ORF type:complete len:635 (+),score=108.09 TRINITY_DN1464_c0_g1_i2:228-2132(+)